MSLEDSPADRDHLRPRTHFTARRTWLNDPNGLVRHDGVHHLFFQTNPEGSTFGNLSWGHATSSDLLTWTEHPVALRYSEQEHVYSGSVVVDHQNTSGFGGPGQVPLVAVFTSHYLAASPRHGTQAQSLAFSLDDGLTWTMAQDVNPVLCRSSADFRDPKVAWCDEVGGWLMVAVEAVERRVLLHRSDDLRTWTELSSFGPVPEATGLWECPDLFRVPVAGTDDWHWVLLVSVGSGGPTGGSATGYVLGDFDGTAFVPLEGPDGRWRWLDHGPDLYAAVSFNGVPERRLVMGWASSWVYATATPTAPWRSAMSYAREVDLVRLDGGGLALRQRPVAPDDAEVEASGVTRTRVVLPRGPGHHGEVRLTTADGGDPLVVRVDGDTGRLSLDRSGCGDTTFHPGFVPTASADLVTSAPEVEVDVVADGCVVEVYAEGGLTVLTALVFPRAPLSEVVVTTR